MRGGRRLLVVAEESPGSSDAFIAGEVAPLAEAGWSIVIASARRPAPPTLVRRAPGDLAPAVTLAPPRFAGSLARAARAARFGRRLVAAAVRRPRVAIALTRRARAGSGRWWQTLEPYGAFAVLSFDAVLFETAALAGEFPRMGALFAVPVTVRCSPRDVVALEVGAARYKSVLSSLSDHQSGSYCISRDLNRRIAKLSVLPNSLEVIVPPPRPVAPCQRGGRAALNIAMAAPLEYLAGYELVLVALARLRDEGVEFRARIAGAGSLDRYLHFTSDSLGLGDRVEWLGALEEAAIARLIAESDCFVTSLLEETTEYPAPSALGAGAIMLSGSTATGGATDLVTDGVNGWVVPCRDSSALTAALARLSGESGRLARSAFASASAARGAELAAAGYLEQMAVRVFARPSGERSGLSAPARV